MCALHVSALLIRNLLKRYFHSTPKPIKIDLTTDAKGLRLMNRKQAGMTLIEVIAAIALLSIVILSFAYVFIQSQQVTTNNGDRLTALQLAQKRLSDALDDPDLTEKPDVTNTSAPPRPNPGDANLVKIIHAESDNDTIDHTTYKSYVYLFKEDSDEKRMIVVRTYYNGTKYVELYNYYTITSN
jgi:prepilin-type N-terminal cleavage/methylation domain-containing protein